MGTHPHIKRDTHHRPNEKFLVFVLLRSKFEMKTLTETTRSFELDARNEKYLALVHVHAAWSLLFIFRQICLLPCPL